MHFSNRADITQVTSSDISFRLLDICSTALIAFSLSFENSERKQRFGEIEDNGLQPQHAAYEMTGNALTCIENATFRDLISCQ